MDKKAPGSVPPLSMEVMIPDSAEAAEMVFEVTSKAPGAFLEPIEHVVSLFKAAVNAAMLSGGRADAGLQVTPAENPVSGRLEQRWKVKGIGPGAYRVFLNMLDVAHLYQTPLASFRLISSAKEGKRLNRHAIMASPYPGRGAPVPFELRLRENLADTKDPLTRLEFSKEITDDEFDKPEELFTAWDHLITHGGYGHEYRELELDDSIVLGETYMGSPNTLEHMLSCTIGSPEAFDAQINMVLKLHQTFCSVLSLEIE